MGWLPLLAAVLNAHAMCCKNMSCSTTCTLYTYVYMHEKNMLKFDNYLLVFMNRACPLVFCVLDIKLS